MDDRHTGGQPERLHLGRRGHPGPDLLLEVVESVAQLFEAGVDATGSGVRFGDRRTASDVERQVGGGELHGPLVEQIPTPTSQHPPHRPEPGGDVLTGLLLLDLQAVDLGVTAGRVRFDDEGGLALLPVPPCEPVGGEPPHWRPRPDEDALAVLCVHEPFSLEDGEGVPDRHAGYPVMLDKVSLGGQLVTLSESPTVDGLTQLVGDLPEDRTITRGVEIAEEAGRKSAHVYSFRYLDVWASLVATVESLASREGRGT